MNRELTPEQALDEGIIDDLSMISDNAVSVIVNEDGYYIEKLEDDAGFSVMMYNEQKEFAVESRAWNWLESRM